MRKHIIVTGPESSGKTTLSKQIAERYGGIWIPEYARGYLEALNRRAILEDFPHFVAALKNLVQAGFAQQDRLGNKHSIIVQDTGHEVLCNWQQDKFGASPLTINSCLNVRPDLFIICRPDLPWEYDQLREDPHRREELFNKIRNSLSCIEAPVLEVSGFDESRFNCVSDYLNTLLE